MSADMPTCSETKRPLINGPVGLILAGGQARRMNGADKASIEIAGRPMIDRVAARLAPQCAGLIVSANDPAPAVKSRWTCIGDPYDVAPFSGPLAGVLAALDWIAANAPGTRHIITSSVDAPFLPLDLANRLQAARATGEHRMAVARSAGRMHPVFALWDVGLRDELREALHGGLRKIGLWMTQHHAAEAIWDVAPFDPFLNVNTPEDAVEATRLARAHPQLA